MKKVIGTNMPLIKTCQLNPGKPITQQTISKSNTPLPMTCQKESERCDLTFNNLWTKSTASLGPNT